MICPKCEKETQGPDFCGHCGTAIRIRCKKCEEMEAIGCTYCRKEYKKIFTLRDSFVVSYALKDKRVLTQWGFSCACIVIGMLFTIDMEKHMLNSIFFISFLCLGSLFAATKASRTQRKACAAGEKIFIEQHPEYKQILECEERSKP